MILSVPRDGRVRGFEHSNALFTEGAGNRGGWQFGEEEEGEQRAADRANPNWVKQAVLLLTSPKVQSGFLGANQLVSKRPFTAFSSLILFYDSLISSWTPLSPISVGLSKCREGQRGQGLLFPSERLGNRVLCC